jgi:acyl carrier protein
MNNDAMEQAIVRFVNEHLVGGGGASVATDDEIVLDGTVDSLGVTRLIEFLEREYSITIPAQDVTVEHFRSVSTMAAYVVERRDLERG